MTITSITELTTPRTVDAIVTSELATLSAEGFPVDAWAEGGAARSLVKADATALAVSEGIVADLAKGAYGDTATGDWLDLLAASRFSLTRIAATYATGEVRLTVASGVGPFSIPAGGLLVSDGTLRWRSTNTGVVTISSAAVATLTVRAEVAGEEYNAGNNTITSILAPALPGVSCNNPAIGVTSTWLSASAVNREGDAALLARCRARWATLAFGAGTRAAYGYLLSSATMDNTATGASCGITRYGFGSPGGDGTVPMAIAGSTGLLTDGQRDAARTYVLARCALTDTPQINHASTVAIDLSTSTVTFKAGFNTTANRAAVRSAIAAYVNAFAMGSDSETPILDREGVAASVYASVPGGFVDVDLGFSDATIPALTIATVDTSTITFA